MNILQQTIRKTVFSILLVLPGIYLSAQSLSGRVTDSLSHLPLYGATLYFPELKLGAIVNNKGNFKIAPLPEGKYKLMIQMIGHVSLTVEIVIKSDITVEFRLPVAAASLNEVTITALGYTTTLKRTPVPVTVVSQNMFLQQASTNVIDAIAKLPGITEITEGPGISKPEINGLGYNRVLTLFDGERQEDFQWGDEHGILIDPYAVYNAEIIRGPASLQYGANAVAGVVSFNSDPFVEKGTVQGNLLSEYQANNGLIGNSINIGGNKNGIAFNLRGSYEAAHCYWDPHDGYVWGTAFIQSNFRAELGFNKSWVRSRLSISILHRHIEVPDGNRDSSTNQFQFDYPQNGHLNPDKTYFLSYKPTIAGDQVLEHDELWWQNSFPLANGKIEADIGYSQSIRHEIDSGSIAEYNLIVHDVPYSFKFRTESNNNGMKLTTGINGMYEFGNNYPEPPSPYIGHSEIPDYTDFDMGGFGIFERVFENLTLSGGLRYDLRKISGEPMYLINYNTPLQQQVPSGTIGAYQQYVGFSNTYTGLSGSLGASYQLPGNSYLKLNFSKSFRAPSIQELNSNALNAGSNAYILGYTNLKAEQGYETDIAFGIHNKEFNFEVAGFSNFINNFIFQVRLAGINGGDSILQGFPVFQYQANSATISGITAYFNFNPSIAKWLEWRNGFTYIYSILPHQTDSTQHVPWTPAPRLTSKLRVKLSDKKSVIIKGVYFELGAEHDWGQRSIYSELNTELPSFAYTIFDAGFGINFESKKTKHTICSLNINCTNLTNISYVDHGSHVQYFLAYHGSPVTVTRQNQGIYNMGRNLGIKLIFPFGTHKIMERVVQEIQY
jgi:iron complex outermembrane recepter protein